MVTSTYSCVGRKTLQRASAAAKVGRDQALPTCSGFELKVYGGDVSSAPAKQGIEMGLLAILVKQ